MSLTFYHATSSHFLNSIKRLGLGGLNPNIEHNQLDILVFLTGLAEKHLHKDPIYNSLRETTLAMAEQRSLAYEAGKGQKIELNFKHDSIYVTLSMIRAAVYCSTNPIGSEILDRCLTLRDLLKTNSVDAQIPKELGESDLININRSDIRPILIKFQSEEKDQFLTELGEDADNELNFFEKSIPEMNEKEEFELLQYSNYRINKPIDASKLVFYEFDWEGTPGDKNFEFTLSRI